VDNFTGGPCNIILSKPRLYYRKSFLRRDWQSDVENFKAQKKPFRAFGAPRIRKGKREDDIVSFLIIKIRFFYGN
jgi:hypothetical protein